MTKLSGNKNATTWKPEHDAALKEHRANGYSVSQVATAINEEFQTSYTRNAAMGRMHRLGMSSPMVVKSVKPKAPEKPRHRPGRYKPVADRDLQKARPMKFNQSWSPSEPYVPCCDEMEPGTLTLLEVADIDGCRWPTGDGSESQPYRFCGALKFEGTSYCPTHAGAAVRYDVYVRRAG